MERIHRVYDKSEPELDERTFTVSDPWKLNSQTKKDMKFAGRKDR